MRQLVSVVIPTYNSEKFIEECLSSVLGQTYNYWECIIVDDHSNDNTFEIVTRYQALDNRFRVYKRPNSKIKGANSCRNFGFEKSKGVYFKWFDSDDIMLKNHLEVVVAELSKNQHDLVITESEIFGTKTKSERPYCYDKKIELSSENVAKNLTGWLICDMTFHKSSIQYIALNEYLRAGQEYNFNVRILEKGLKGIIINKVLSLYRQHDDSISVKSRKNNLKYFTIQCDIKYQTFQDLNKSANNNLKKWFLEGYMRLAFKLAVIKVLHRNLMMAAIYIAYLFGFIRAVVFVFGILLGLISGRGYNLVKYSRKNSRYEL